MAVYILFFQYYWTLGNSGGGVILAGFTADIMPFYPS
jgi:hypothetical protein